jgi:hypothetical protein
MCIIPQSPAISVLRFFVRCIASLLFLPLLSLAQTSIVVLKTSDAIVAAADSKTSVFDYTKRNVLSSGSMCKIHKAGELYVVYSGLGQIDGTFGYDVPILANAVVKEKTRFVDRFALLKETVLQRLSMNLMVTKQTPNLPFNFEGMVRAGGFSLEVALFGFENGTPMVDAFCINPKLAVTGMTILPEPLQTLVTIGDVTVFALGRKDGLIDFAPKHPELWKLDPVDAARFLVTYEVLDSPAEVGMPIDILRLDKNETNWIQRKQECASTQLKK